ncbi:GNAT family acetyltransferase [Marinomonas sp. CT5]|uniref:GNAT family acetyltransferase n=1 Tax=Marinomonas sp. CT5 TaxID=2066133 RepID=UPI0017E652A1|nr:GNAT family acetyltransferase [Marinomonas sp. CT5]NVK73309.1 GNAT family acetyltransferase [Oceanospirillaceae bacterium]QUX96283.1 GNAT family acetyltransferase [Marinomonas sp. CT5]
MKIRLFTQNDREAVKSLWQRCDLTKPWNDPDKDISRKLAYQPDLFFVGEDTESGEVIASAMAGYDGHRGSVFYLAISPDHQGKGYGKDVMQHIETVLTGLGCPKLNIVVRSSNAQVLAFYDKQGYTPDSVTSIGKRLIPDV